MPQPIVIAENTIDDFSIGQVFSFSVTLNKSDVESFAQLSGDINPLHMDEDFAQQRGFKGRVVHGLLLAGYLSKLVGVYFPGKHAVLHSVNINFLSPVYINDTITVECIVHQISLSTETLILKVVMKSIDGNTIFLRGKVQVGFTKQMDTDD